MDGRWTTRKRESGMNLETLLSALEDEVTAMRRAKSEPPTLSRPSSSRGPQMHVEITVETETTPTEEGAPTTWTQATLHSPPEHIDDESTATKRRKIGENGEMAVAQSGKKDGDEEVTVPYMTPPKSPDHEQPGSIEEARQMLMNSVNEFRLANNEAVTVISQLAQMAYCYNKKERPGGSDYDNMQQLVHFYTNAPQLRDPADAADRPFWFMPQKMYLMRRQVRERLYGAVSVMRSKQVYSKPVIPDQFKGNPLMISMIEEATALAKNCHTLSLLLEDLHSIPDL